MFDVSITAKPYIRQKYLRKLICSKIFVFNMVMITVMEAVRGQKHNSDSHFGTLPQITVHPSAPYLQF